MGLAMGAKVISAEKAAGPKSCRHDASPAAMAGGMGGAKMASIGPRPGSLGAVCDTAEADPAG